MNEILKILEDADRQTQNLIDVCDSMSIEQLQEAIYERDRSLLVLSGLDGQLTNSGHDVESCIRRIINSNAILVEHIRRKQAKLTEEFSMRKRTNKVLNAYLRESE